MILYFSGTGNSAYAAKRLAEMLNDEMLDLSEMIRTGTHSAIESEKAWVIVTPTYAWQIPHIVRDLLKATPLLGNNEIYYVMTCGDGIGNADRYNRMLSGSKGMAHRGTQKVIMPENYIAMFNAPNEDTAKKIVADAEGTIAEIASKIAGREQLSENTNVIDRVLSSIVNRAFFSFVVKDKAFTALEDCVSCGKCEKICPMQNITIENGRPIWHGNCTHCMRCICYCPKEAIEYGKKSKGQPRYKCPV